MAKLKLNIIAWKMHTCSCCSSKYRYPIHFKQVCHGATPALAEFAAKTVVAKVLKQTTHLQPCPECGLVQPDMIGPRRAKNHWIATPDSGIDTNSIEKGNFFLDLQLYDILLTLIKGNWFLYIYDDQK